MVRKVAVIMGGRSTEREISLHTGEQICHALRKKGHTAISLDLDESIILNLKSAQVDVVFIALHGKFGEDGTLQGLLEILGIPYVGSGVLASALAMDKAMSKKVFVYEGIPTPLGLMLHKSQLECNDKNDLFKQIEKDIPYPMVVKPTSQGSTIGLTIVPSQDGLWEALKQAFSYDNEVLVEQFIKGTEITVGILGNRDPIALPVVEIVFLTGVYDYEAKYTKGLSEHIIPARISREVYARSQELGLRAHKALGCRGMSRVDMIVDQNGSIYVLELNTIPGMTELSLFPDAARAIGIEFPDLVDNLINLAFKE